MEVHERRSRHALAQRPPQGRQPSPVAGQADCDLYVLLDAVGDQLVEPERGQPAAAEAFDIGPARKRDDRDPLPQALASRGVAVEREGIERDVGAGD